MTQSRFKTGPIRGAGGFGTPAQNQLAGPFIHPDTVSSSGTLRLLCLLSAGPIKGLANGAKSIFLDDVPLEDQEGNSNFEGVTYSLATGDETTSPHKALGFNGVEHIEPVGRILRPSIAQEVSRSDAHAVRIAVRFPQGLYQRTTQILAPARVTLTMTYFQNGKWHIARRTTIEEKQTNAFEKQFLLYLPQDSSDKKIRIERAAASDATGTVLVDRVDLLAVTWVLWDRLSYHAMGTLGLVIPSDIANGRVPQLSFEVQGRAILVPSSYDASKRTYQPLWNGRFVRAYSNNPAWVIYDLLHDNQFGLGIAKAHIAIFDLLSIARYCDELIDHPTKGQSPRFTFNAVIRARKPALALIQEICATIRVLFFWSGGKLHFTQDTAQSPQRLITNEGVEEGRFSYAGAALAHSYSHVFVSFLDDARDGKLSVETEFDEAAHRRTGYHPLEVFGLGCTDRAQAKRHARWLMRTAATARHTISYIASLDHYTDDPVRPGDVIAIDDRLAFFNKGADDCFTRRLLPNDVLYNDPPSHELLSEITQSNGLYLIAKGIPSGTWRCFYQLPDSAIMQAGIYAFPAAEGARFQKVRIFAPSTPPPPNWRAPVLHTQLTIRRTSETVVLPDFRVASVREISAQRIEVTAIAYDKSQFAAIDGAVSLPDDITTDLQKATAPLLPLTAMSALQEDVWHNGVLRHNLALAWTDNRHEGAPTWLIEAYGPEGQRRQWTSDAPYITIEDLSVGAWDMTVRLQRLDGLKGKALTKQVTIKAEIAPLPVPAKPQVTALREALSFALQPPVINGTVQAYEIWRMKADSPAGGTADIRLAVSAASVIFVALTTVEPASYAWRYVRASGKISAFSASITVAPLPAARDGQKGQDGLDGNDGNDGLDGTDGQDGNDGNDGNDGKDGLDGADGQDGNDGNDGNDGLDGQDGVDGNDGQDGVDGTDGQDGKDGQDGNDGKDGQDGQDGKDGQDGEHGTQIAKADITGTSWSSQAASQAILAQAARPPQNGDLVTLANQAKGYVESRLYDGVTWQAGVRLLSGAVLLDASVPASSLASVRANQIDGGIFASTNYKAGISGFSIDTAGNVEFNQATLRGLLQSGRIEASHILAPTITLPCEGGGRFQTHFLARPIRPRSTYYNQSVLRTTPMVVANDSYSHFFDDENKPILSAADKRGDNEDATRNSYFTRFRANAPLVKTEMIFTQTPTNWGRLIQDIGVEIIIKLGTKIVAKSRKLHAGSKVLTTTYIAFSSRTTHTDVGFQGQIIGHFSRVHNHRPGHSQFSAGCTQSYSISLEFRPILPTSLSVSDAALYCEFRLSPIAHNLTTDLIGATMLEGFTVEMDSLS